MLCNPSSGYTFAARARKAVDLARERLAALLGCEPSEIVFTSGGTESNNAVIHSALQFAPLGKHVITSAVEHSAVLRPCQDLEKRGGTVTFLGVDQDGNLDLANFEAAIRPETALVSTMWANNETGVLFPVEKIAEICRRKGVPFHTDAVQAVGKIRQWYSLRNEPICLGENSRCAGMNRAKLILLAVVGAVCTQDLKCQNYTQLWDNKQSSLEGLAGIQNDVPYSLGRNSLIFSCESKHHVFVKTGQTERQTTFAFPRLSALDARDEDRSPTIPIGLPAALIASMLTARLHSTLLAKHVREKRLKCRDISSLQKTRIALQALSLGFLLAALLAVLEVSLRYFL